MTTRRRILLALVASGALAAGFSGGALADDASGQHVATCAQTTLGQRDKAPVFSGSYDGMIMTFANFGAMVEYMRTPG